ncbi:MAG: ATP-binding protein [Rhodospirillaceae bacterium]
MSQRISVRTRLMGVFLASALFAVLAGAVGLGVFKSVTTSQSALINESLPIVDRARELARRSQAIAAAAPALVSATGEAEFRSALERIQDQLDRLSVLVEEISTEESMDVSDQIDLLREKSASLQLLINRIADQVSQRIKLEARIDASLENARAEVGQLSKVLTGQAGQGPFDPTARLRGTDNIPPNVILAMVLTERLATILESVPSLSLGNVTVAQRRYETLLINLNELVGPDGPPQAQTAFQALRARITGGQSPFSLQADRSRVASLADQLLAGYQMEANRLIYSADTVVRDTTYEIRTVSETLTEELDTSGSILIAIMIVSALGALALAANADQAISGRLADVVRALRRRDSGQDYAIPVVGNDEIADLAKALERTIRISDDRQERLASSEGRLKTLTDTLPEAILAIETRPELEDDVLCWGAVVSANPAASRLLTGIDAPESSQIVGRNLCDLLAKLALRKVISRGNTGQTSLFLGDESATVVTPEAIAKLLDQASVTESHLTVSGRSAHDIAFRSELTFHRALDHRAQDGLAEFETVTGVGQNTLVVLTLRDITARFAAEQDRERYVAMLASALEASEDGIMISSNEGPVISYNSRFYELWGLNTEETAKKPRPERLRLTSQKMADPTGYIGRLTELGSKPDEVATDILHLANGGILERFTAPFRIGGVLIGRVWSLRDITERERARQELTAAKEAAEKALIELEEAQEGRVEAEKLASLGQLVAGVAHEINTPIGITVTAASHIHDETQRFKAEIDEGKIRRSRFEAYLELINTSSDLLLSNAHRASELIQSFKQVAVDQASDERRIFNVGDYIHEVLVSLGPRLRKTNHKVSISCPPDLSMDGYPGAISQVITNLIINALVHAFPETEEPVDPGERPRDSTGGIIDIRVLAKSPETIELVFQDNGQGMSEEVRAKAFDPFFTTRRGRGGSGLGLNIVYNLVTATLGGRIVLRSQPGEGTTFLIMLPRVHPGISLQKAPRPQVEPKQPVNQNGPGQYGQRLAN